MSFVIYISIGLLLVFLTLSGVPVGEIVIAAAMIFLIGITLYAIIKKEWWILMLLAGLALFGGAGGWFYE